MNILHPALVVMAAILLAPGSAAADPRDHHRGGGQAPPARPHASVRHFSGHAPERAHVDHRHHEQHAGRPGWSWSAGSVRHYYPAPAFAPAHVHLHRAPVVTFVAAPAAVQFWYYCPDPAGYYPAVAACRYDWQRVPASVGIGYQ